MKVSAIVLAAGKAERMPNKALLPIGDGRMVIQSAIDFCQSMVDDVIVVVSPGSPIPLVLDRLYHDLTFAIQPKARGPVDAIQRGALVARDADKVIVTFCDNMYDPREAPSIQTALGSIIDKASVRESDLPELDGHTGQGWCSRDMKPNLKLAGWLTLQRSKVVASDKVTLPDFLNDLNVSPVAMEGFNWWDLGTEASYQAFLETEVKDEDDSGV